MHQARMPPRCTIAIVHEQGGTRRQSHGSRQRQRGRNPLHRSEQTSAPVSIRFDDCDYCRKEMIGKT